jgi:translocation and assembly module TamA
MARLRVRLDDDVQRLTKVLRSEGYYDSKIEPTVDAGKPPHRITLKITLGPAYALAAFDITYTTTTRDDWPSSAESLSLRLGARARAPDVIEAERQVLRILAERGRPFAERRDRRAVVNHEKRIMTVSLVIDPGAETRFGTAVFEGLDAVEPSYLRKFVGWRTGALYDQRQVDAFATRLRATLLFSSVLVEPAAAASPSGTRDIRARLVERKARSIGAGARYSTGEGPEAEVFWEHRNIGGRQETLRLTAIGGEIRQRAEASGRIPHFRRLDQDLFGASTFTRQSTDAFRENSFRQTAGIERRLSPIWTAAAGGLLELSQIVENERTTAETKERFLLFGLPFWVRRDDTDDPLDPTRGSRLRLEVTPFFVPVTDSTAFLRTEVSVSGYQSVYQNGRVVLAGRAKLGVIGGPRTDLIPSNKRFFAGGGGSIRGFAFQDVGPLDAEAEPIGGRSLIELGAEIRVRVTKTIGLVPFIEAGDVYDAAVPDFPRMLRFGAGLGLRYFSPIGPLRLDLAVPLNAPNGVTNGLQFYVSVGQAF